MKTTITLWLQCSEHFGGGPVPTDVPSKELEELRGIYASGDLWKGEGPKGTPEERMVAFAASERVERILGSVLTGNLPPKSVERT